MPQWRKSKPRALDDSPTYIDDSLRRLQRNLADDVVVGRKRTEADIWAGNFRLGAPDC